MALTIYNETALQRAPQLVVFDLDHTFYDYDRAHAAALKAAAERAQAVLNVRGEQFAALYAAARKDVGSRLKGQASSHSRLHYFICLCDLAGVGVQPAVALDLDQTYWMAFFNNAPLFPEAAEFLDDLRLAAIQAVLVTDLLTHIQYRKLVYWGLDRAFTHVVTSEEAGADKPDPAPYRLLLEKIGERPEVIWSIGDSVDKDMAGSKAHLGATTFLRCAAAPSVQPDTVDAAFTEFGSLRRTFADLLEGTGADSERVRGGIFVTPS